MSETLRRDLPGDALQANPEDDELEGGLSLSFGLGDIVDRLWHLLISMRVGLALMLFLASLALAGTLLEQAPAGLTASPAEYNLWVAGLHSRYGGWTDVFNTLGLLSVFGSIWFKVGVVLLATSLLACSINRAPRLWRVATHPRVAASDGFLQHAPLTGSATTSGDAREAASALDRELRRRHYRTIVTEEEAGFALYADRFRWGPFGTVAAHLAMIVILAGAVLGTMQGFRLTDFAIAVDADSAHPAVPIGQGTNLSVRANSFSDSYYDNGTPADYASDIVVYDNGQQIAQKTIRVNDPLRIGDITLFQSFYGPAADVRVTDAEGATVLEQGVPLVWRSNDDRKAVGQFDIPSQGLTVYIWSAASGVVVPDLKPGQVEFEVYATGNLNTPVGIQVVDQGKTVEIGGLTFGFVREEQFTGLIVAKDPGAPLVWLGAILLIGGTILVFLFPHRRIWARVGRAGNGTHIQVAAASRHDVSFETSFRELIDTVRQALPASGA